MKKPLAIKKKRIPVTGNFNMQRIIKVAEKCEAKNLKFSDINLVGWAWQWDKTCGGQWAFTEDPETAKNIKKGGMIVHKAKAKLELLSPA